MHRWPILAVAASAALGACIANPADPQELHYGWVPHDGGAGASAEGGTKPSTILPPLIPGDVAITLNDPVAAHDELCTADSDHPAFPDDADLITRMFCADKKTGGVMPTPASLADLLKLLGLDFKDPNGQNGVNGNPGFALLAHSSALTARKVSVITPTAFIFTPPPADGSMPAGPFIILGFDPGEQFVEVASYDATVQNMNFYVVFFEQACTHAPGGCTNADLLTPKLVTGWSNLRVYEDTTALGNTIFDCHVCHQPVDANAPFLRMQEIAAPFTHWMSTSTEGGRALLADFHAAHPANEDYGGIPAAMLDQSDPSKLAALIKQAGFGDQPNAFPSQAIEAEIKASAPAQPATNVPAGTSATWQALYDKAVLGQFIAPPYHDVKVSDPAKLATMTRAYKDFASGAAQTLPDIRDVFFDDGLRDMGFAPKLGSDGKTLLSQMCQECHNSSLDMTITREKFLVDKLDTMPRDEKDTAIQRLQLGLDTRLTMPPPLFRTITDDERQKMIDELRK